MSEMNPSLFPGVLELVSKPCLYKPCFFFVRKKRGGLLPHQELNFPSPFICAMMLSQEMMMVVVLEAWNTLLHWKGSSAGHTVLVWAGAQALEPQRARLLLRYPPTSFNRGFTGKEQAFFPLHAHVVLRGMSVHQNEGMAIVCACIMA